jgi:hypothetical protein
VRVRAPRRLRRGGGQDKNERKKKIHGKKLKNKRKKILREKKSIFFGYRPFSSGMCII